MNSAPRQVLMIDSHNHLQQVPGFEAGSEAASMERLQELGIRQLWVNGTCEADWPRVAALAQKYPELVRPFFGLHPWYIRQRSEDWLARLRELLLAHPEAGLGECGLDGWTQDSAIQEQIPVFEAQIDLALELNRPLSVHALKAWQESYHCLKPLAGRQNSFLLHAFGVNRQQMQSFSRLGAYFSFNSYFMKPSKSLVREAFSQAPAERLLVETDAPAMPPDPEHCHPEFAELASQGHNHPANLLRSYGLLAELRHESLESLQAQCAQNARAFFARPGAV